jgi:hypothetical protein
LMFTPASQSGSRILLHNNPQLMCPEMQVSNGGGSSF